MNDHPSKADHLNAKEIDDYMKALENDRQVDLKEIRNRLEDSIRDYARTARELDRRAAEEEEAGIKHPEFYRDDEFVDSPYDPVRDAQHLTAYVEDGTCVVISPYRPGGMCEIRLDSTDQIESFIRDLRRAKAEVERNKSR
jgi:hypothetical protein